MAAILSPHTKSEPLLTAITSCNDRVMVSVIEKRFWPTVRRAAMSAGMIADRLENSVDDGWPDVLVRGDDNLHIWIELKIAVGPKARIKVRPGQINWAEDHAARGGIVRLLARDARSPNIIWVVNPSRIRACAKYGCVGEPCYDQSLLPSLIRRWSGERVILQQAHPPSSQSRPRMARAAREDPFGGTFVPDLRGTRLQGSRRDS